VYARSRGFRVADKEKEKQKSCSPSQRKKKAKKERTRRKRDKRVAAPDRALLHRKLQASPVSPFLKARAGASTRTDRVKGSDCHGAGAPTIDIYTRRGARVLSDHDISFVLRAFINSEEKTSEYLVGTLQAREGSSAEESSKTGVCVWSCMWSGFLCVEWILVKTPSRLQRLRHQLESQKTSTEATLRSSARVRQRCRLQAGLVHAD